MVVYPFSCSADTLRGQLKHSWLENQVRDIDADDIVMFWKDQDWVDTVETIFPHCLKQVLALAEELAEGFSPAQLIDKLAPFKALSGDVRGQVKEAIHDAYLEASNITSLKEPIRKCVQDLEPELETLRNLWKMSFSPETEIALRDCWENIRTKGLALRDQLEKLPRGVIIP